MGEPAPTGPTRSLQVSSGDRLDSWKEIAAHLKRSITTVQRWEHHEGLPVRRHLHDKRGSVYALRSEIDAWWEGGRNRLEGGEAATADDLPGSAGPPRPAGMSQGRSRSTLEFSLKLGLVAVLVRITFASTTPGPSHLYWFDAEGSAPPEVLLKNQFGTFPSSWSSNGVAVTFVPSFVAGRPSLLLEGPYERHPTAGHAANYDVASDGQGFVMITREEEPAPQQILLVSNWLEALRRSASHAKSGSR